MKAFYFFLFLAAALSSPSAGAQALRGGFSSTYFIGSDSYWFGNGRFKEVSTGCLGFCYGSGTYRLTGNRLVLHYDRSTSRMRGDDESAPSVATIPPVAKADTATQEFIVPVPTATTPALDSPYVFRPLSALEFRDKCPPDTFTIYSSPHSNTGITHTHFRQVLYLNRRTRTTFYVGESRYQRMTLTEIRALLAQYERCRRGGNPY